MTGLVRLLQLTDSAFPSGAYAFSDGLESYAQTGAVRDAAGLRALLESSLRLGWGRSDAPGCALAWSAFPDAAALEELNEHLGAMKVVAGPRKASLRVGAALLRAAGVLWPEAPLEPVPDASHHAVAFGAVSRALGVGRAEAVAGLASGWAIGRATAATRLFSIGGLAAQRVVRDLEPVLLETAAAALEAGLSDLWSFTPGLDLAAHAQAGLEMRLFQS